MIDEIEVKTEPVRLEVGMKIAFDEAGCYITVGGGQMPEYVAHGRTLEEAISDLVESVTKDAIEGEAREWQNRFGKSF